MCSTVVRFIALPMNQSRQLSEADFRETKNLSKVKPYNVVSLWGALSHGCVLKTRHSWFKRELGLFLFRSLLPDDWL